MKIPTIEEMLKAGMHFGHRTSKWHPKMEPFIFTSRSGVHIIDLSKSQKMLASALEILKKTAAEGKTVLFVGTKTQVKKTMKGIALETGMPYVTEKWLGGTLTNFNIVKRSIKKYKDLLELKKTPKFERYTKKERSELEKEMERLETRFGGLVSLGKTPDMIFVWDIKKEKTAVTEAVKKNIPIMAVCDTNVNPTGINYIIPSNDDATKTIKLLLNLVGEAVKEGKNAKNKI